MHTENARKVYVDENSGAVLVCPHCGYSRNVNTKTLKINGSALNVKCKCKSIYAVSFEFRRAYRKETNLTGTYCALPACDAWQEMTVENISLTGIGLTTRHEHDLRVGDMVQVKFVLDDKSHSVIQKDVIIRRIVDNYLGCEFTCEIQFDKSLGFYLMP